MSQQSTLKSFSPLLVKVGYSKFEAKLLWSTFLDDVTSESHTELDHLTSCSESESDKDGGESSVSSSLCECPTCTLEGSPCQPTDVRKSKHVYSHRTQRTAKKRSYSRSIQSSWYKKHPWITVCTTSYKVFCHSCCFARKNGLLTFSKRKLTCFLEDGFCNWKKALEKFLEHE